ncbi:FHA domain-containing protein [Phycisphaerales bacterium AB-hyl4]|uniref:FHA domain-containing protein n=1 Tax=Natronomicrosphaera hydrolytica TaxID=3242702 RepID=A0ABV4TZQ3_9BACT
MLKLLAVHRDGSEKLLRVHPGKADVLGRRAPRLTLEDSCVSRQHARVWFENDCWWLVDLDSTHGTWVNHDRVEQPTPLRLGDEIRLGRMLLVVREADATADDSPTNPTSTPPAAAAETQAKAAAASPPDDHPKPDRDAREASSASASQDRLDPTTPLQADEVIIAPSVSLDDAAIATPYAPSPTPQLAADESAPAITFTTFGDSPANADDNGLARHDPRREEDIDPLADDQANDPDATPTTLNGAARRDPVAGNFGVIFPQTGRPGGSHHNRHSRPSSSDRTARHSDAGQKHSRWVTLAAFAVAGTMAAVATTAWLMYPG